MIQRRAALACLVVAMALAAPARGQFSPMFDHLECRKITGPVLLATLVFDNQFGRELSVKMKPALLCAPTEKTCCAAGSVNCSAVVPCPPSPSPNQPAPVDHFKCYVVHPKNCVGFNASIPGNCPSFGPQSPVVVHLNDQFGTQVNVKLGASKLFCAPVQKFVGTIPCTSITITGGNTAVCGAGQCPPGMFCAKNSTNTACQCY